MILSKLSRRLGRMQATLAGRGRPTPAHEWDRDYSAGHWDRLENLSELGHYAVITGYVSRMCAGGRILDVGAGSGVLRSYFDDAKVGDYLGTDLSAEAVRQANAREFPNSRFVTGDFENVPDGVYDAVIFNESIYYAEDPRAVMERYWRALGPGGICVVSVFNFGVRSRAIWRRLAAVQTPALATRVQNERGESWDVKVFRKDSANRSENTQS